jgi:signal transduction histidine kinase
MYSKSKTFALIALFLFVPLQKTFAIQDEDSKNILIIFSLNQGLIAYQILLENFKNTLREEYSKPYKLYVEYLNVGDFPDTSYQQFLFNRINEKYKEIPIDLLILGGPRTASIIKPYISNHIKNLPSISMDIFNPFEKNPEYSIHPNTTEIIQHFDIKKNFDLAFALFPDHSTLCIISGASKTDLFFNNLSMNAAREYEKKKKVINLINLSVSEVINEVAKLPPKSIVFIPTFLMDAQNLRYNTPELIRIISKNTSAPIFVLFDTPFNDGAFGGYVTSEAEAGIECGRAVIKILGGEEPNTIHVNPKVMNKYIFDWHELKRRGLEDSDLIPANSIILNKEPNFIDTNKWLISGALLFIILQTLLIVNLVQLNRKQKVTTKKLLESENRFRELVREERILQMGELAASLSHELNQPLTAIRNSAQAGLRIMKKNKIDPAIIDEILQNIVEDDKRAAEVLSSIRQLLKLEKREKQKIDLNQMIKQVADIFKGELIIKNIKLQLNLSENLVYVSADSIQIQQVLLNFVSNAAQAMEDVKDDKRVIKIFEEIVNNKVIVSVRDYGTGIDETIKGKLFKPFATTKEKGFGIGLAISKTIIDEHEGKIWADNNSDGGATFSFQLNLWDYDPKG